MCHCVVLQRKWATVSLGSQLLTVYALPGGGASVEIERESSLPGVGRVAAGWRKRPATLTMRRVRSFSSLARWNEPPRARSLARDRSNAA